MPKKTKDSIVSFKLLIIIITLLWIFSAIISWYILKTWIAESEFYEAFNIINSLFSSLALAGIIYTVFLQKKELSFQRKELQYTREELKRTASAQENTAKSMAEQIRLTNFPYLDYNSEIYDDKKSIIISSKNDNVAFDIEINIFSFVEDSDYSLSNFIKKNIKKEYQEELKDIPLLDDTLWGFSEIGYYPSLSKNRKIIIPFSFPIQEGNYGIFIQFRDVLGNNYSNTLNFTEYANYETTKENPFSGIRIEPNYPLMTERLSLIKEMSEKNYPDHIKEVIKLKRSTFNINVLKNREFRSNNFKWLMD